MICLGFYTVGRDSARCLGETQALMEKGGERDGYGGKKRKGRKKKKKGEVCECDDFYHFTSLGVT